MIDKSVLIDLLWECGDEWYKWPCRGMRKSVLEERMLKRSAFILLIQYVRKSPLEPTTYGDCITILESYSNMMKDGLYESKSKESKAKWQAGLEVAYALMDVIFAAVDEEAKN